MILSGSEVKRNDFGLCTNCLCIKRIRLPSLGICVSCYNKNMGFQTNNNVDNRNLQVRYGITNLEKEKMLEKQNFGCAICERVIKLSVDHCHKTNRVRGLLCINCNTALGHFKDDPMLLQKAIEYLQKHE